ncbi:hypothetical protein TSTA_109980 [Talaromyces stipitatus ATCC 10500]|uniref:Uncharacterized protein n=1 Tax=Talaromyces stipitatus (strain ATCC 10500 / CBS 375.48 / QM 6759 / NRRL 1006) TaxID=441959 RepID=B8MUT0_TALSN|nr:uncharacterized protein TSTA_109980 [Talaromyces stipitatus ATCC 10500]EED11818.1 hypothetical protein TSTA_109980 [Talaromyces stipitatus ATCC 10500]
MPSDGVPVGRAATRTPEPPDRDEHENSPPRLRPKRTTKPPKDYAQEQEQEKETEQRKTHSQQKRKTQKRPATQCDAPTGDESATESEDLSEDLDTAKLVKELIKLRKEIRRQDEMHKEELKKVKEEFSAALAEVRQEMQTLTLLSRSESCSQNSYDDILHEIQSLRTSITTLDSANHLSYADVAHTPATNTSKIVDNKSDRTSAGSIRAVVEKEIRTMENHMNWRCRAVIMDPKNAYQIRIACRDEAEHQLVKKVAEAKISAGARVLRDKLYPIKVDSVRKAAVLDEIRAGATAAFSEENDTTVAKIAWLSSKESAKAYSSMVVYLTKGTDARRLLADGFFHAGRESSVTSVFEY